MTRRLVSEDEMTAVLKQYEAAKEQLLDIGMPYIERRCLEPVKAQFPNAAELCLYFEEGDDPDMAVRFAPDSAAITEQEIPSGSELYRTLRPLFRLIQTVNGKQAEICLLDDNAI